MFCKICHMLQGITEEGYIVLQRPQIILLVDSSRAFYCMPLTSVRVFIRLKQLKETDQTHTYGMSTWRMDDGLIC